MNLARQQQSYYNLDTIHWANDNSPMPRHLPAERQLTLATRVVAEGFLNQAFHIIASNSLGHRVHLPKQVIIAYTKIHSSASHDYQMETQKVSALRRIKTRVPTHKVARRLPNTSTRLRL